jgi:hypothetical protein
MYRNKKNDEPRGLVISTPIGNATHIFDVVFRDQETLEGLIVQFSKEMQKKGFSSASIRLLEGGPYSRVFEKMNFRPREDSAPLMAFGDESLIRNLWFFTDGDRNI